MGLGIGNLRGGVVQGGLAEALLIHAGRIEQRVGDDGVEHSHAALVEDAHDGLVAAELFGELRTELLRFARDPDFLERRDVVELVLDLAVVEEGGELVGESASGKILTPEGRVFHPGFGQRAVEVEHSDQPWPLTGPVGDRADRTLVADQAVQHVMRVLPDGLGNDDRSIGIDAVAEDLHPLLLRLDESVFLVVLVLMGANELIPRRRDGFGQLFFHRLLRRPADLVGAEAQIAVGDELDLFSFQLACRAVRCHAAI